MFYKTVLQERKQKRKLAHVDVICVTTKQLVLRSEGLHQAVQQKLIRSPGSTADREGISRRIIVTYSLGMY